MNLSLYIHLKLKVLITVQKNLDSLYVGVLLADKKGGKGGTPSLTGL